MTKSQGWIFRSRVFFNATTTRQFKFQWQEVRDEYLGLGFSSMSPQRDSKFWMKNGRQNDAGMFLIVRNTIYNPNILSVDY